MSWLFGALEDIAAAGGDGITVRAG
jgi:hypothetical protein